MVELKSTEIIEKLFLGTAEPLNEGAAFGQINYEINNNYKFVGIKSNSNTIKIEGSAMNLLQSFEKIIEPKRKNKKIQIDLLKMLEEGIVKRGQRAKGNKYAADIPAIHSRILFEKLDFDDFGRMFRTMKL